MSNEVPNLQDEINRKTNEAIVNLFTRYKNKVISSSQLHTGLIAIWETASGLADWDIMNMVSQAQDHVEMDDMKRRVFINDRGEIVMLEKLTGSDHYTLKSMPRYGEGWGKIANKAFAEEVIPSLAAEESMIKAADKLHQLNYMEL